MTSLFDTHCHLDAPEFDDDRDAAWARAEAADVVGAIVPAVEPASWAKTLACSRDGGRYAALGVHPQYLPRLTAAALDDALAALVTSARKTSELPSKPHSPTATTRGPDDRAEVTRAASASSSAAAVRRGRYCGWTPRAA